ncbi:MAG: hypothetical protein ACJAVD_001647, partial [Porticoccaceae bacterium]
RYYKGDGSPYKIEHKLDQFRNTTGKNKGLKTKFSSAINELKNAEKGSNRTVIYIILILVFVFFYIIDFDLSIFLTK